MLLLFFLSFNKLQEIIIYCKTNGVTINKLWWYDGVGDRSFSKWKGSVVDSVVGAFLTQNVNDVLSRWVFLYYEVFSLLYKVFVQFHILLK